MKYGNQSIWKKLISSPITLLGFLILFFFLFRAAWSVHEKAVLSELKLKTAQIELNKLEAHQRDLSNQIGYLSTEQGIEAELRTKYRAVKEGELVAVIVDNNQNVANISAVTATTTATTTESNGWGRRLLRMFGL
ncbi:MAG: hypothetical protein WCS89_00600 [Candidatus Paceibacterota bacterium]|jgi:hypothetical protein